MTAVPPITILWVTALLWGSANSAAALSSSSNIASDWLGLIGSICQPA